MDRKRIKDLYESGTPLARIYRTVSVSRGEFRSIIEEMRKNGEISIGKRKIEELVVKAFDEGERDVREIAYRFGIKEKTVYIYLNRNDRHFGKKSTHYRHCERTLNIADDIKEGELSYSAIAKKHGVSRQYVSKVKDMVGGGTL